MRVRKARDRLDLPHLGAVATFLRFWTTSLPPGVLTTLFLADLVLYEHRVRRVTRWAIVWIQSQTDETNSVSQLMATS